MTQSKWLRTISVGGLTLAVLAATGCQKKPAAAAGSGPQGLPVQTATVVMAPVAQSSEYVATIKSRRSTTLIPQVSGLLTTINVHSGEHVKTGQVLMTIDPRQQQARWTPHAPPSGRRRRSSTTTRSSWIASRSCSKPGDQPRHVPTGAAGLCEFQGGLRVGCGARKTQEQLLDYFTIRAPFDGVVGDIPVHVGDYVSPSASPATC